MEVCCRQIRDLDAWAAAGVALQAHAPLVEEEEPGAFHMAAEGRLGRSPGLQRVKSAATGAFLSSAQEVEDEITAYFVTSWSSYSKVAGVAIPK